MVFGRFRLSEMLLNLMEDLSQLSKLREDFKKKKCIFYDIVSKGRGVKDKNQIFKNILNYDKRG